LDENVPLWQRPRARLYAVVLGMWLIALVVFLVAARVLLPFELAFLFAYAINPIISGIASRRVGGWQVPRSAAVLLVYAVIAVLLWLFGVSLLPQIYGEMVRGLTELRDFAAELGPDDVRRWAVHIQAVLDRYNIPIELVPGDLADRPHLSVDLVALLTSLLRDLTTWARAQLGDIIGISGAFIGGITRTIFFVTLLIMVTAFVSMDAPRIAAWTGSIVPTAWRGDWERLVSIVDQGLAGVVRGQLTICLVNGVLTLIGLLLIEVPFPFALAALATVLYLVPFFGTILSSIPIVLLALGGGLTKGALALGWIIGIHALETYVLNPKIMGDASKIHPVLIVLALVVGEHYFGIVGALLAVPTASLVASIFKFMHLKAQELDARLNPPPPPPPPAAAAS
jgi:predicted PurR-regulated permease PerM